MSQNNKCIHCGAECGKHPVIWQDKSFCCNGCKQVYRLLNEHKLSKYYSFETTPGIKIEQEAHSSKYAFLDKPEVKEKLYDFYEAPSARVTFYIPAIHCISCVWLLEHLEKLNSGIVQSSINFIKKELTVNFNTNKITLRQLVELLASIHYTPEISLKSLEKKNVSPIDRKLWYKIGVAGFVFGNVMLYSLPEYFSGKPLEGNLGIFLSYLSFILTIPVVFYSGIDYIASAVKNLVKGIINIDLPIAIGIITLFSVTGYEIISQTGQGYSDSLAGFLFFLLIGRWYQSKTYQSLSFERDYKSYFPIAVSKLKDNQEISTLLEELKTGDELLIRNKELIPTDSVLTDGTALIDYSFVTGESNPVKKEKGEVIYAGGIQTGGSIKVKVEREVSQSHLTRLWNQSSGKAANRGVLEALIDRISVYFTLIVIVISISGLAFWLLKGNLGTAVLVFTSVLIVACPCALALSTPFTFGNAMRILGSKGMYLKNTGIIEKLTKIDTVVFDKTGTLTVPDTNQVEFIGEALSHKEIQQIVSITSHSIHPMSNAITKHFSGVVKSNTEGFVEVPGRGLFAKVDKQPVRLGSHEYIFEKPDLMSDTSSSVYVKINDKIKGRFKISNKYRDGFSDVLNEMKRNYDMYLLSGDNNAEQKNLGDYFDMDKMHFYQQPEDKMNFIKKLHSNGKKVIMTGDGLNDAGAFMQSDVALSIADDIYHFSPAGDAIIEAEKFGQLGRFIKYARRSMKIVKISFVISFLYNTIGLGFALTGNLSPVVAAILMPVSSVTIVAFTTLGTHLLARRVL